MFYPFLVFAAFFKTSSFALSNDISVLSDIAYGKSKRQALDVYYPSVKKPNMPVIFMVHGGAWRIGDKASRGVIKNKVDHWVPKGFVFISINYRMLPDIHPAQQAEDVAKALVFSQKNAHKWGGSSSKFILMGHSAGAHLVSLITVRPSDEIEPWLGTIALDSAAYNIESVMKEKSPPRLYKKAFGENPTYWKDASPMYGLNHKLRPFLAVCSSKRKDNPCLQAKNFVEKANKYQSQAELLPINLSHREINVQLGQANCYTQGIDSFMEKLDPSVSLLLKDQSNPQSGQKTLQSCTD